MKFSIMLTFSSLGRRKLMMFAVIGQGCCMAILAGTIWDGGKSAGLVATVMLFVFNFFFAVGLLAIPWLREYFHISVYSPVYLVLIWYIRDSPRGVLTTCNSNPISRHGNCNKLYVLSLLYHSKKLYLHVY